MQRRAAHHLDVEVALADDPLGGLAHHRVGLGQQVVQRLAVGQPLAERISLRAQLGIRHLDVVGLERVDVLGDRLEPADDLAFPGAEDLVQYHGATSAPSKRLHTIVSGSTTRHPGCRTDGRPTPCRKVGMARLPRGRDEEAA